MRIFFALLFAVTTLMSTAEARPGFLKGMLEPLDGRTSEPLAEMLGKLEATTVRSYPAFTVIQVPDRRREEVERVIGSAGFRAAIQDDWDFVFMPGATVDTRRPPLLVSGMLSSYPGDEGLFVIQLEAPLDAAWASQIEKAGLLYVTYLPYNAVLVYGNQSAVAHLANDPQVQWTSLYHPVFRAQPTDLSSNDRVGRYVVQLANVPGNEGVISELLQASLSEGQVTSYGPFVNVTAEVHPEILRRLIRDPRVVAIERAAAPMLSGEREAVAATGSTISTTEPYQDGSQPYKPAGNYKTWLSNRNVLSQLGQQTIAVADTGLAGGNTLPLPPDFPSSTLISWMNYCGGGSTFGVDKVGHGTLVAGFAAGNPSGAGQDLKGVQYFNYGMGLGPGARIYAQRISDDGGSFCGSITTWAQDAINAKGSAHSIVQTHSHNDYALAKVSGVCTQVADGAYTTEAQAFDYAVRDNGLPIIVSAGNVCQFFKTTDCPSDLSRPCPSRVLPPATAKNVLSMGASESYRPGMTPPCDHNTVPIRQAEDYWASTFNRVAFVSRQGTTDGRIKPDIVAPASMASSTMRTDTLKPFCKKPDPNLPTGVGVNGLYTIDTGTSFAAPQAAGAMAVVNAFWGSLPALSPAALKAVLVGSSVSLKGGINDLWNSTINARPNTAQGFGRLNLAMALSSQPIQGFLDEASWPAFTGAGQVASRPFTVYDRSKAAVIVLAWSDEPAAAQAVKTLVRDLNLETFLDDGCTTYVGNSLHPTTEYSLPGTTCGSKKAPDSKNNVEMIVIPPNMASSFTVTVKTATWGGTVPQKFAVYYYNAYP